MFLGTHVDLASWQHAKPLLGTCALDLYVGFAPFCLSGERQIRAKKEPRHDVTRLFELLNRSSLWLKVQVFCLEEL